ncbi:melanoma-associated antigen 10-like [Dorcoceras hygrometricum]|uniref:Melanoma-associated antigen 10-like n=1 Tax=Dorcoceras hygrometricum TaxID=472368 RepID=A0A2Z6ZXH4_9LAMI|nr:melanoma-associated antigen 10-like [Dorcoceras hygrometricum]
MSGRDRGITCFMEGEGETDGNNPVLASMAQLLECLVDQSYPGNGQSSGRMIEHVEPLGSLGLNDAGDDPVDFMPTGGEDL